MLGQITSRRESADLRGRQYQAFRARGELSYSMAHENTNCLRHDATRRFRVPPDYDALSDLYTRCEDYYREMPAKDAMIHEDTLCFR